MRAPGRGRSAPALLLLAGLLLAAPAVAVAQAYVGLIIDDMGYDLPLGREALALPGPLTYSFLPHTPYARQLAILAHRRHKQVMLHVPMEAMDGARLGPGGLTVGMTHAHFLQVLDSDLDSVPYVRGVNNHMGSLLTQKRTPMRWLMARLSRIGGLYFVDSRTTVRTVALKTADAAGVPATRRNVFLDDIRKRAAITVQFHRLVALARRDGYAIGIAHPHPHTLKALRALLPTLKKDGIKLVPVSRLVVMREERRFRLWQASLSPSQRVVKSSKP